MLYNIRYWCFSFLKLIDEQNNLSIPKYGGQSLACWFCVFGRFGRLSPAAVHSADWWFDSRVKWWIHVLSIVTYFRQTFFALKQLQTTLWIVEVLLFLIDFWSHFERSFLIEKLSCKIVNTLSSDIFNSSAIWCNFNLRSAKKFRWVFWRFPRIWITWIFSIFCVCTSAHEVSIPPLNYCIKRNRVWITLIKLLLCLNIMCSHQKATPYLYTKFICFENLQQ